MKVILPVAGKGERMRPYTNNLPKCLLPIGGKTIIDWIVADTLPLNATETIFITGYKASAVEEFLKNRPQWGKTRGEFQLTDALQMMIEKGCKFRTAPVQEWLDCGLPETLVQTNTWLLQNRIQPIEYNYPSSTIIPPCVIGKNVTIVNSTIGPYVAIGDNCSLKNEAMKDCIIWDNETLNYSHIEGQIIASC